MGKGPMERKLKFEKKNKDLIKLPKREIPYTQTPIYTRQVMTGATTTKANTVHRCEN